jgi:hypothetical protein
MHQINNVLSKHETDIILTINIKTITSHKQYCNTDTTTMLQSEEKNVPFSTIYYRRRKVTSFDLCHDKNLDSVNFLHGVYLD